MSDVDSTREELREFLKEAARDIPDWGITPNPDKWLAAFEAFIDAKLAAARTT